MKKVFLSIAVAGLTEWETIESHKKYWPKIEELIGPFEDISIGTHGTSEFHKEGKNKPPIWWLGKGMSEQMAIADLVVICGDISNTRGCKIEKLACELYGIPHLILRWEN